MIATCPSKAQILHTGRLETGGIQKTVMREALPAMNEIRTETGQMAGKAEVGY